MTFGGNARDPRPLLPASGVVHSMCTWSAYTNCFTYRISTTPLHRRTRLEHKYLASLPSKSRRSLCTKGHLPADETDIEMHRHWGDTTGDREDTTLCPPSYFRFFSSPNSLTSKLTYLSAMSSYRSDHKVRESKTSPRAACATAYLGWPQAESRSRATAVIGGQQ